MLVKLIQRVNEEVSRLCVDSAVPAFVSEWLRRRPDTKAEIAKTVPGNDDAERQMTLDGAIVSMAKGALGRIKKIPEMTNVMLERLQARGTEPAVRCALASILAYVVQPRDLIPDNAPGGYGFLDDAVMVHAGYLNVPPPKAKPGQLKAEEQYLRFLAGFMPREATVALQQTVQSLEISLAFYRMCPTDMLDMTTKIMIENPLLPVNGGGAGLKSSSVLLASRVTPTYTHQASGKRTVVNFPGGGGVAADASGIKPVETKALKGKAEGGKKKEEKKDSAGDPPVADSPTVPTPKSKSDKPLDKKPEAEEARASTEHVNIEDRAQKGRTEKAARSAEIKAMSKAEIEREIRTLPREQALALQGWLSDHLKGPGELAA